MRRHLAACAALLVLAGNPAGAEYGGSYSPAFVAPTPLALDNTNRIATTEWVNLTLSAGLPLAAGAIFIGNGSNIATARTPSGDCTISQLGAITCTQSAGAFTVNGVLTVNGTIVDATGGLSIGSPTGGSQGAGTVNVATGYYLNGVLQPKWLAAGVSGGIPFFNSTTTMASSALLAANQIVLGGGAGVTPATLGSLGTTTTVLHGNAAGAPTFGAVSLTADVTGRLPLANLTQGTARSVLGVTGNAGADVASIQGSAGQILGVPNAGTSLAFTATPQLGVSGTLGSLTFGNATSGLLTLQPVAGALGTVTVLVPAASDTLVGKATTDIFTNKTFDTAGAGNSFSIASVAVTANTGTGAVARAAGPVFTTPTLGVAAATSINFGGAALANYSEGTWTPIDSSGAGLSFTGVSAGYTRIGRMVFAYAALTYPATADASVVLIGGLPFATANAAYARQCSLSLKTEATVATIAPGSNATTLSLFTSAGGAITNATMSTDFVYFICVYPVS